MLAPVLLAVLAAARRLHDDPNHAEQEFIDAGEKLKRFEDTDLRDLRRDVAQNGFRGSPESFIEQHANYHRPLNLQYPDEDPEEKKFDREEKAEERKWKKMERGFHVLEKRMHDQWSSPLLSEKKHASSSFLQEDEADPTSSTFKDSMATQIAEQKEKLTSFIEKQKKKFHEEVDANKKKTDEMIAAMRAKEEAQEKAINDKLAKQVKPISLMESQPQHEDFERDDRERQKDAEDLQMIRAKLEAQEARMSSAQKALREDMEHSGRDDLSRAALHLDKNLEPPSLKDMGMES